MSLAQWPIVQQRHLHFGEQLPRVVSPAHPSAAPLGSRNAPPCCQIPKVLRSVQRIQPPGCPLRAGNPHPAPTASPCPASAHPDRSGPTPRSLLVRAGLISVRGIRYSSCSCVMLPAPPKRLSGTQSGMMLAAGTRPVAGSGEPHTMRPESSGPDGPTAGIQAATARRSPSRHPSPRTWRSRPPAPIVQRSTAPSSPMSARHRSTSC